MPDQPQLFDFQPTTASKEPTQKINFETLQQWKAKVINFQMDINQPQQMSLFSEDTKPEIEPFALKLHNWEFFEWGKNEGDNCLYFVLDNACKLLLYIGETKRSPTQRWKGKHDVKDYISRYIILHRQHKLDVAVCVALYWNVPGEKIALRELEQQLIQQWRSPFNKESWKHWGKLF